MIIIARRTDRGGTTSIEMENSGVPVDVVVDEISRI